MHGHVQGEPAGEDGARENRNLLYGLPEELTLLHPKVNVPIHVGAYDLLDGSDALVTPNV